MSNGFTGSVTFLTTDNNVLEKSIRTMFRIPEFRKLVAGLRPHMQQYLKGTMNIRMVAWRMMGWNFLGREGAVKYQYRFTDKKLHIITYNRMLETEETTYSYDEFVKAILSVEKEREKCHS